jgi:FixJ family two-component response regulator
MPGPSGLEVQEALARQEESLPIIFLTGHGDIPMSVRAMKAGAVDFLTKPVKKEALLGAVNTALMRAEKRRDERELLRTSRSCFEKLTAREREVFEHVVSGKRNKEIAAELGTAERTVKAHRAQVMDKMGATSLAHLVQMADRMRASGSAAAPR